MLSTKEQVRIAQRYNDALSGYAKAAINATFEANARTLAAWSELSQALNPSEPVHEWSGAPRRPRTALMAEPQRTPPLPNPFEVFARAFGLNAGQPGALWPVAQAPSPFAWWAWMPQSAVPDTWPWAYGMISSGVPGSVAWPMAEASVALLDAATQTAEAVKAPFPVYRSDSGFAAVQAWTAPWVRKAA